MLNIAYKLLCLIPRLFLAVAVAGTVLVSAQEPSSAKQAGSAPATRRVRGQRSHVTVPPKKPDAKPSPSPTPTQPAAPVVLVNAQPEYYSGEANISVKGNQNPIVRLGLAQNGSNVIEFPASDSFFMVHPGNSDLVSCDEDTAKRSKRTLVLHPGSAFVAPPAGSATRSPSTSISVQMQSGLIVTFLIYPVRELSQNAHRVVVTYNREEVVAARRAAGLQVNLDGKDPEPPKRDSTVRFGDYANADNSPELISSPSATKQRAVLIADVNSTAADERARSGKVSKKKAKVPEAANRALKDAVKSPAKVGEFSKPSHGLSLAVAPVTDLDAETRMVLVGVRNDSKDALRLVAGNPEIYVQTFDDQGKPLQIEQVKRLHVESTLLDGKLTAGSIAYFAVVYEAPVLGARQRLRVSVSQTEAADEPATTAVGNSEAKRN
jgi:hypothetical protein